MKIISYILVLIEITKKVHSLKCHDNLLNQEPKPIDCATMCAYINLNGEIARECMPKGNQKAGCTKTTFGMNLTTTCFCAEDNCNHECTASNCKNPSPVPNDAKARQMKTDGVEECEAICKNTTDTKTTEGQNSTEDNALGTTKDDKNPTDDSDAATDDDNQQPTGDNDEAEHAKTTGNPATSRGNERDVESNQFVFVLWLLITLIIKSV